MATYPNFHSAILQLSDKRPDARTSHIDGFVTGMCFAMKRVRDRLIEKYHSTLSISLSLSLPALI